MKETGGLTFWEHLDELRKVLVRVLIVLVVLMAGMFFLKEELFAVVLAPGHDDFILYEWMRNIGQALSAESMSPGRFNVDLINTELTGQLMAHIRIAFYASLIVGFPYILWEVFGFVAPALYRNERKVAVMMLTAGQVLFYIGVLLSYMLIFPLSFRFLSLYEVSKEVSNMIQLKSYLDTLLMLSLMMGVMFEIPLASLLLSRLGIIDSKMMCRYRKHAILAILILAAIITPTTDVFTLLMVGFPIYVLYELSILAVRIFGKKVTE